MDLLNEYLISVNTYPKFKRRYARIFDRFLVKFAGVSLLLLLTKFLVEWLIESM